MPRNPSLAFHPLTPSRWRDFEALFGPNGACGGCWCMAWRLTPAEYKAGKGAGNRRRMRRLVQSGRSPGVIAYVGDEPIGWCAVAPREEYGFLTRSRVLKPVDDTPVWSVSCLFITRPFRRQGISAQLLQAAVRFAAEQGAKVVEGYPVVPQSSGMPDVFAWTGLPSAFLRAGFREVARRSPTRPIMRWEPARLRTIKR